MYKIEFNRLDKQYRFKMNDKLVEKGNLERVTWAAIEYGLDQGELEVVYQTMVKNKHVMCEFGINRYFLISR